MLLKREGQLFRLLEKGVEKMQDLMDEHYEMLQKLAFTYVKDIALAQDIVQDVCVKIIEKGDQFRGESTYKTYLMKMTINRCHDYLRSWSYRNHVLTNQFYNLFTKISPEMTLIEKNEKTTLAIHIFQLKPKYREVIVLYYYEDLPVKEIAELLSCSENTVKTRLSRARHQLKERIGVWENEGTN